uniref:Uncharacterized protein n=1 Tax=Helianthus annuus TaxID=4232 RepID=A0A251SHR8_HELAN
MLATYVAPTWRLIPVGMSQTIPSSLSPPKPICHLSVNHHHTTGDAPTTTTPPETLRPPPSTPSRHPRRPPSATSSRQRRQPPSANPTRHRRRPPPATPSRTRSFFTASVPATAAHRGFEGEKELDDKITELHELVSPFGKFRSKW